MKPVTVTILKKELKEHTHQELIEICLKLAKFKKENKELLTYALFDSRDEDQYIREIKEEIDVEFSKLNHDSLYYVKKSIRKILRLLKKYIRYSKKKETEADILLHFCGKLKELKPAHKRSLQIINIYDRQLAMAKKAISTLHEDIQYDFHLEIEELEDN
ncbi:hypothetical protein H2O64_16515 [Kordia sp. YSTF-M3]|uniref:Uncharacterized protein n=1 Tax=Kordia aestuariivivens TaxID=2759037 RepID=A0ABR7QCK5_9FLAO|nr:hypothetical protein [Kordia aestuariivivens]MBC8756279.1 hypothetical protein [Kordia aestuariivivens]